MRVAVMGAGRVASALRSMMQASASGEAVIVDPTSDLAGFDLLVGTMPGRLGPVALRRAIEARLDLVDLTDLETEDYVEHAAAIDAASIAVHPGAGFCPGLVNAIIGHELARGTAREIEVIAGSLSPVPSYFPFLWCFEDMVHEFGGESVQILDGEERLCPPFGGERVESFFGIESESYLCQSGFENLARRAGLSSFSYRNLRPKGFRTFFAYLRAHGAFEPEVVATTKALLERRLHDNLSLATVQVDGPTRRTWHVTTRAAADAPMNSMQHITAACTLAFAKRAAANRRPGTHWSEAVGEDATSFERLVDELRRLGVEIELREGADAAS